MRRSSEQTKAVILAAARERFAESGFERATIRAIAADANIDPSMVMRYFGNKDQLFAAAADFDLQIPDLSDVDARQTSAPRWSTHFMDRWERDEALVVLLRSSATNAEAAQRMREIFAGQLLPVIAKMNSDEPQRRAGLIATQMLGLALCRYVLRLPPVVGMSRDEIVCWLGPTVQRYLGGTGIIGGDVDSRPAGPWRGCVHNEHLSRPGGERALHAVGPSPFRCQHEKGATIRPAQHRGEDRPVVFDALQHVAAFFDAYARALGGVGAAGVGTRVGCLGPDGAVGIETDPVGSHVLGPGTTIREAAVGADVESRQPSGERLGDDEG